MKINKLYLTPIKKFTDIEPWDSSAQIFENRLKRHGIKLPIKLYYKYKIPDDMPLQEYYAITHKYEIFILFYTAYLAQKHKHKIKHFTDDLFNFIFRDGRCSLNELFYYYVCLDLPDTICESAFRKTYKQASRYMRKTAKELIRLNPELKGIKNYKSLAFVMGVVYGFAPKEIDFFTTLEQNRIQRAKKLGSMDAVFKEEERGKYREIAHTNKNDKTIHNLVGFYPGYILAPETGDIIIKTICTTNRKTKTL